MGISILLADDHALIALGIKKILETMPDYEMVGHMQNGREVILYLEKENQVDVLVLDLNMPVMDGMQLLSYLNRNYPDLKKMVLSAHHTQSTMEICRNLGVNGFVGKDACFEAFQEAIEVIADGGEYFQPLSINKNIQNGHRNCLYQKLRVEYSLSDRETEIIQLILNQIETKQIAKNLNLSPLTVKTHRKNIFRKLKVHNVAGLLGLIKEHPGL
ncbi:response regulator [Aquiflexum lacus]|uniref:response regulator n=1 Tax=Aquiflexum lacus TaxID=2483805 RepID=UPI001895FE75|nr:response regulator transcription factor [Aquiflexum lacus]